MIYKRFLAIMFCMSLIICSISTITVFGADTPEERREDFSRAATIDLAQGAVHTVKVPVYIEGSAVRVYIIDPENARSGLQSIFDWIESYHQKKDDNAQAEVVLPAGRFTLHTVTEKEKALYKASGGTGAWKPEPYLALYSNTTLDMSSGATLFLGGDQRSHCMMRFGRLDEYAAGYSTFRNINIIGGTLDGNGTTHPLLRFSHSENVTVRGVKFTNIFKQHHFEFAGCRNVSVESCVFDKYLSDNYGSSNNHEALQIDVLTPTAFPGAGISGYDGTMNRDITVKNCTFKHCKRGIGSHTGIVGLYHRNIKITNNKFIDTIGYSIGSINWKDATITGNKMSGARGIYFRHLSGPNHRKYLPNIYTAGEQVDPNSNSIIEDNTITVTESVEDTSHFGVATFGEVVKDRFPAKNSIGETTYTDADGKLKTYGFVPVGDYRVKNLSIKNNRVITKCHSQGIWLRGAKDCSIESNTISNSYNAAEAKYAGIWDTSGRSNKITSNSITDETKSLYGGIVLKRTAGDKIFKNTIQGAGEYGILSFKKAKANDDGGTVPSIIKDNTIKDIGEYCIGVSRKALVRVSQNNITSCSHNNKIRRDV